ncbi:unnamed protein product [Didymodactylos carnosus]|uniref:Transporter n=1 Tax=Didymodactylos carnosus TaxID=1234261 RepID=A0A814S5X8_9BILA|nr:unnamed protein product [Didymodactylos carnosus]CAF1141784.1 unnamed protein product [Didymodactylos carnosus]CAF3805031.1 unnamed protein product [Didymodactylos carnosus]CAF3905465.1 unnamed protein product [Didymodactylos carnosus]
MAELTRIIGNGKAAECVGNIKFRKESVQVSENSVSERGTTTTTTTSTVLSTASPSLCHADTEAIVCRNTTFIETVEKLPIREQWTNKVEFLLSVIGYVVDLGNVWRFPYMCFDNGGGAFLIPYMIFLCVIGIPMMYLELFLGQNYRCGNITLWGRISPSMKGIGVSSFLIVTAVTLFYTTIIAHAVFYLFASFREIMPWSLCSHSWNTLNCVERMRLNQNELDKINFVESNQITSYKNMTNLFNLTTMSPLFFSSLTNFSNNNNSNQSLPIIQKTSSADEYYNIYMLGINRSSGLTNLSNIKLDLLLCLISIFILMYICIYRGVKSTGKAVYITAILPYLVLIILLVQGLNLKGSRVGIQYFLKPNFQKLKDMKVWFSAANQIFFTLGPGLSVLTTYGSYNLSNNNCYYDALIAVVANFTASFLAGFVVFSGLGHMSYRLKKHITKVVGQGQGASLSFIAYPEILATFKYPTFFSILFFLMVINLGLDSDFGGLEAMYTALSDEYPLLKRNRKSGMLIMCGLLIIACLPTVTQGGNYVVQFLDKFSTAPSLMLVVMLEAIAATWIYGIKNLVNDMRVNLGFEPNLFFRIAWTVLCPLIVILLMILSLTYSDALTYGNYVFPQWSIVFGWCLNICFILPVPFYILRTFFRSTRGTIRERLQRLFQSNKSLIKWQQENGAIANV